METKLGTPLSIRQRSGLRRQCSAAKERLLNDPNLEVRRDHRAGRRLVADRRNAEDRDHRAKKRWSWRWKASCPSPRRGEAPKEEKRSLFRELGLPYVSDPAITRHLNAFLERHRPGRPTPFCSTAASSSRRFCAQRVADVVERWYGRRPEIFENRDLDLAVARGAAYYSYVRSTGSGVLVRGGLPRAYYIGLGEPREGKFPAVCLVPRGAEEGATVEIDNGALQLVANQPGFLPALQLAARAPDDQLGDVVEFAVATIPTCTCTRRSTP